jgi:hypothetical protein
VAPPCAAGYRALGQLRLQPWWYSGSLCWGWFSARWPQVSRPETRDRAQLSELPGEWSEVRMADNWSGGWNPNPFVPGRWLFHLTYPTRREAEGAAALAFAKLPPDRQAELSSTTPGRSSTDPEGTEEDGAAEGEEVR